MAVVHVEEITGRDGDQGTDTRRRYTRIFQVLTDDARQAAKSVRDHEDIPDYGDIWEGIGEDGNPEQDDESRLVQKRAIQGDGENLLNWMVYCEYVGLGDPTAQPPDVQWTSEKYQETSQKDADGVLVANSAGVPFETGITRDRSRRVLTITRNLLEWNPGDYDEYIDTLNSFPFLQERYPGAYPTGLCKIDEIDGVAVYYDDYPERDDIYYWRVTARVSIDRRGWSALILDAGFQELNEAEDGLRSILLDHKSASTPVPLDGQGHRLPVGFDPNTDPVYLEFPKYEYKDWNPIADVIEY